jgi:hypothetical protein
MVTLPARNGRADATTLFDQQHAVFYEAAADRRTFTLLSRPDKVAWRTGLMRVVRELASNHVEGVGGLILHAAGLAVNGRALALAGPSAAGKTTLLIHALRIGQARYLANDRIRVAFAGDTVTFRGMPTVVTLRPDTRARLPDLAARLAASTYDYRFTLAEGGGPPQPWRDGRLGLTPAQFCDLLGAPRAAECPAAALVFPRITGVRGGVVLVRLTPHEVRARLVGALLAAGAGRRPTALFIPPGTPSLPDADVLTARCRRLAALLPGYECRLGLDAYADPGSVVPLLELCA